MIQKIAGGAALHFEGSLLSTCPLLVDPALPGLFDSLLVFLCLRVPLERFHTCRSHIVFAQFQDAPVSFIVRHPFACNLVGEMTKGQEVVVAERRDNGENNHFVGSCNLKEMGSKRSA